MADTVRAFVAIELPEHVRRALAELTEVLGATGISTLRLVRPEGIHLTLKFLGNVPAGQVERIAAEVSRSAAPHSPFDLALAGVGVFPNRRAPRVLWAGVDGDLDALNGLQSDVEDSLETLGLPRDKREFNPHLTLARLGDGASREDRDRAAEVLFEAGFGPVTLRANSVSLIESVLRPQGAEYRRLAKALLSGSHTRPIGA